MTILHSLKLSRGMERLEDGFSPVLHSCLSATGPFQPMEIELSQKYQLSVLIGVDFWATDASLSQSTETARRALAFRLYGGINELVDELRLAIHGGDRRRALYACDMIDKYIKP